MSNFAECATLNHHAAINHQMELDAATTMCERISARQRISCRRSSRAVRQKVRLAALDGALLGVAATGLTVLVTLALI